jgi:hypothetical protein
VLRAAEPLVQGAEVTVSYLGSLITAPYESRQAELQEKYGFACGCPRCAVRGCSNGPRFCGRLAARDASLQPG